LNANSEVLYAESNGGLTKNLIPADGRFNQQWGLRNLIVPNADIHAVPAWDIFTGNPNSIIAVIDNGVDRNHNDLSAKITGGDNGFIIETDRFGRQFSHGSHVAGIAAAVTNNTDNIGVAGVDWQARIHPKNIFDGNGDPDITQSIIDAINFNTNVWTLNNSWGLINGIDGSGNGIPGRYSVTVRTAFAQAYRNNRVQCVSMGNHQSYSDGIYANVVSYPAGFNTGIIAVGATDDHDHVADFSAQGPHIDVAAPGVEIWSTNFNDGYIDLSGTSMATAFVSGLASLLKGFNTNLANDDIEQIIRLTSDDANAAEGFPGFDNRIGAGRINALTALQALQAPNTLQHLSATGGTIISTSGNMTRVFLGVPGLADAAYIVKRSEVRKTIALPAMCNTIGVWGRGVGTTGYREEMGRCFGEGICEIVPGTLTSSGATLRTWIYEVWTTNGQYLGFYPNSANNVVFQYTILGIPPPSEIIGPTFVCNTSDYRIDNLQSGATVAWSASGGGAVFELSPNTPTTNQLRVTNHKWYNSSTTLTATISNHGCGIPDIIKTKYIMNDNSTSPTEAFSYYQEPCTFYNISHPAQSGTAYSGSSSTFVHEGCMVYLGLDNMVGKTVSLASGSGQPLYWAVGSTSYYPNTLMFQLPHLSGGIPFKFIISGDGVCYEKTLLFFSYSGDGYSQFTVSPNPANNVLTIESNSLNGTNSADVKSSKMPIREIQLVDKMGTLILKKIFSVNSFKENIQINSLKSDVYILKIFDGSSWHSQKVIVAH